MTYEEILAEAALDREHHDHVVESSEVSTSEDGERLIDVRLEESLLLLVRDELRDARGTEPRPAGLQKGDVLRIYGRLFGVVRGIALVERGAVTAVFRYLTKEQAEAKHLQEVAEMKSERKRRWEEKKHDVARRVALMPGPFQRRFEFFMRRLEWGPEFGAYEVFCMEEAVKISRICKTAERVREFAQADHAAQKAAAEAASVALGDGHSGNTFAAACHLAHAYIARPELLSMIHGALCPLVGCVEYGCYASTAAASADAKDDET